MINKSNKQKGKNNHSCPAVSFGNDHFLGLAYGATVRFGVGCLDVGHYDQFPFCESSPTRSESINLLLPHYTAQTFFEQAIRDCG